jgi:hypothetical protein
MKPQTLYSVRDIVCTAIKQHSQIECFKPYVAWKKPQQILIPETQVQPRIKWRMIWMYLHMLRWEKLCSRGRGAWTTTATGANELPLQQLLERKKETPSAERAKGLYMNFRRVITSSDSGMCGIPEKRVENASKLQNKRTNLYSETTTHTPSPKPLRLQLLKGLYFPELIH